MVKLNASSGISGAASGAGVGSGFGLPGTIVGGVLGGLTGLFGGGRKKKKPKKISTLDPDQRKLYKEGMRGLYGQGQFADLYNYNADAANANFDANVSRPAYRNFQENIVPQITGQFRGNNLQNSSYMSDSLARSGRDVQESLDAARSDMMFRGQNEANLAKRNAIENNLNRETFAYQEPDYSANSIDQILQGLAPVGADWLKNSFNRGGNTTPSTPSKPGFVGAPQNIPQYIPRAGVGVR